MFNSEAALAQNRSDDRALRNGRHLAYTTLVSEADETIEEQPVAWNPLTPGGVASFANAPLGQLFQTQGIVAFLIWLVFMFYLSQSWAPAIDQTIEQIPPGSRFSGGRLHLPGPPHFQLSDNRLVGITRTSPDAPDSVSDIKVRLMTNHWQVSTLFGYVALPYPTGEIELTRDGLSPRWGAWRTAIIPLVAGVAAVMVWLSWAMLAAIYSWPIRVIVFFRDKLTTRLGSWKLCSAALLPGALMMTAAILLYTIGQMPVAGLTLAFAIHFILGWVYIASGAIALPLLPDAAQLKGNPFAKDKKRKKRSRNPFRKM